MKRVKRRRTQMQALEEAVFTENLHGYLLDPKLGTSHRFKFRCAVFDHKLCEYCHECYGTVYHAETAPTTEEIRASSHKRCRCFVDSSRTVKAGTATVNGTAGADFIKKYTGLLPEGYIHKQEAKRQGWIPKMGNLWDVLPGVSLYDTHRNDKYKLPQASGRIWFEADINYHGGHRNEHRLLYSNDGLLFVTYDHYQTFFELV